MIVARVDLLTSFIYVKEIRKYVPRITQFQMKKFVLNEKKIFKEREKKKKKIGRPTL
jgi:hypothetical protein